MLYIDTSDLQVELDDLIARHDDEDQTDPLVGDEFDRMTALRLLADEVGGEFFYGETLIPEKDFQNYAQQLAEDVGAYDSNASWPMNHIDWEAAADALREDYSEVVFEGITYLFRA